VASSPEQSKTISLPRNVTSVVKSRTAESKVERGQTILNEDRTWRVRDPRTLRTQGRVIEALRILAKENGNLSTALFDMVQIANSGWKVAAFKPGTTEFSEEGTILANNIMASMDTLYDYTKGFGKKRPIAQIVETLLRETAITGGASMELALDVGRYPDRFQVVDYSTLDWVSDGKGGKYPQQVGFGDPIPLNIPTFYAESLHQEANTAYATSLFRASLEGVFSSMDFIADMKRVLFKAGHSRLVVTLDAESIAASAPEDIRKDDKKLKEYLTSVKTEVEDALKDISPEDAVVSFDSVKFDTHDIGGTKSDYTPLLTSYSNIEATGLKTPPSILGMRAEGSQSLSNSETLIFLKTAASLQGPVAAVMSRALTTACRLYGSDVYVKLKFKEIDLRPPAELEAFYTMREQRIMQRLSYGIITDAEMRYELDIPYRPGAPKLSGTRFYDQPVKQDTSTTTGGQENTLQPDSSTPRKGGGKSQ
jgi:hypothetical protein